MGDGSSRDYGLTICTDCFTLYDIVRLMNVLVIRYGLNCSLHTKKREVGVYYRINIKSGSMPLLRSIVSPHMHPSMMYKLGVCKDS